MRILADTCFNFMKFRSVGISISGVFILFAIILLIMRGLNFGIDFTGGQLIQIQTETNQSVAAVREAVNKIGGDNATIQEYGAPNEFLIRLPVTNQLNTDNMAFELSQVLVPTEVRRVEFVGPQIGDQLRRTAMLAVLFALIGTLLYITLRFEFRYGVGAIIALCHDVILTLGFFSLIWHEISLPVLAALLTVIGYSLNDTIVVYDRIRENRGKFPKMAIADVINSSINQTLSRTVLTSGTTLVVLVCLMLFGGAVIYDFALTLLFGIVVGTYSSIFVASPILTFFESYYQKLAQADESATI